MHDIELPFKKAPSSVVTPDVYSAVGISSAVMVYVPTKFGTLDNAPVE